MLTIRLVFLFVFISCYPMEDLEDFILEDSNKQEMTEFQPGEPGGRASGGIIGSLGEQALEAEKERAIAGGGDGRNKARVMEFELKEIKR